MPNGSFLYSVEFDGSWYDVFARYGNDLADGYIGYDVIDEFGNRLNEGPPLKRVPKEAQVGGLVRWWRADRTVWIRAVAEGLALRRRRQEGQAGVERGLVAAMRPTRSIGDGKRLDGNPRSSDPGFDDLATPVCACHHPACEREQRAGG